MLILHQSNRLENLLDALAGIIAEPLADPFMPETVVVQSQGMARWISLEIAARHGICANFDFPFPAAYAWRLFSRAAAMEGPPPFEPGAMTWALMDILARRLDEPVFAPVAGYVRQGSGQQQRLYCLARELARLFERYLVHRPDWIRQWSAGGGGGPGGHGRWQAELWRALERRHGPCHRVALFDRFIEGLDGRFLERAEVPGRVSLFGIPALAKAQMDVFAALSGYCDVHVFTLTPCREYWLDLVGERSVRRTGGGRLDELHMERGCRLLVGLGAQGRDFQRLLMDYENAVERPCFAEPDETTALGRLQGDILRGTHTGEIAPLAADDHSVSVISAHGPMREVEILADTLLRTLDGNPGVGPADILVMTPDIDRYAPLVEAVFSSAAVDLPYSVADRAAAGPLMTAVAALLALADSRFTAAEVLEFCALEPVMRRFGLDDAAVRTLESWVVDSGIRWGRDAAHRAALGLPGDETATWRHGLDRMILGCALPGDELFHGVLPFDRIEGSDVGALSALLDVHEQLERFVREAARPRPVRQWAVFLLDAMDCFFEVGEDRGRDLVEVRALVNAMAADCEAARAGGDVPFAVFRAALRDGLRRPTGGRNFLGGRVTFCQLVPMRSIPFAMICLLGMNHGDFPRQDRAAGFDLTAASPRPGDRSRRSDDRYLFLETILSARRFLYISYVGQGERDNRSQPPSVVVSELIDHLAERHGLGSDEAWRRFVTPHPLQPFSKRYFTGEFISYSALNHEIAKGRGDRKRRGLFAAGVPGGQGGPAALSLADMAAFFAHPVRYLLRQGLGIDLDDGLREPPERECFAVDGLERYLMVGDLAGRLLEGRGADAAYYEGLRQRSRVPSGTPGRVGFGDCAAEAARFADMVLPYLRGTEEWVDAAWEDDVLRVHGRLPLRAGRHVVFRPVASGMRLSDLTGLWLAHLFLCAAVPERAPESVFLTKTRGFRLPFEPEAGEFLAALATLLRQGMERPLLLFPRSSLAFAEAVFIDGKDEGGGLAAARRCWRRQGRFEGPEAEDPYLAAAFGDADPLEDDPGGFMETARSVIGPVLERREEIAAS